METNVEMFIRHVRKVMLRLTEDDIALIETPEKGFSRSEKREIEGVLHDCHIIWGQCAMVSKRVGM
jgi:hypothetical protein